MEINSWLLFALLYIATLVLISKIIENRRFPTRNLPPGPKPWPVIGNLNLVGSLPHLSLHNLSQKYGEIMLLKFGKFPVIVASSPNMAKQFLKVHDADFASRPLLAAGKYTSYNNSDMTWSPYGPYWRQARKIYTSEVFSQKKMQFFEQFRVQEGRNFLSRLHSLSEKPVVLRDQLQRYTLSTTCRILSRDVNFTSEEDELRGLVDEWFFLTGVFNIGDWIPWLSFLDLQGYVKRMKVLHKKLDRVFNYVIDKHLATRAKDKDFVAKDIVDVFLQISEDPNLDVELTTDCVKALIQEKKSLYSSTEEFQSLVMQVLSWDIRSVSQRSRPHQPSIETEISSDDVENIVNDASQVESCQDEKAFENGVEFCLVWNCLSCFYRPCRCSMHFQKALGI